MGGAGDENMEITRREQAENLLRNSEGCGDIRQSAKVILEWVRWGGSGWVWEDTGEKVDLEIFRELAGAYVEEAGAKRLFFEVYNIKERKTVLKAGEYIHRFSDRYIKRWLVRLKIFKGVRGVFLTLTTDPARHANMKEAADDLKRNWNKFRTYLYKYKGRKIPYLAVMEFSPQSGLPHLHIIFPQQKYLLKKEKIISLWDKYGQGRIVDVGVTRKDVYSYVLKYMFKTVVDNDEVALSPALVWAGGWRMLMMSRGLLPALNNVKNSDFIYTFLGAFYGVDWAMGIIEDYEITLLYLLSLSKRLRERYGVSYGEVLERLG